MRASSLTSSNASTKRALRTSSNTTKRSALTQANANEVAREGEEIDREVSSFGSALICARERATTRVVLFREDARDAILSEYDEDGDGVNEGERTKIACDGARGVFELMAACASVGTGKGKMIGILGLGGGTAARIVAQYDDDASIVGWEIDPAVVAIARRRLGLGELERAGRLECVVGDAFEMCVARGGGEDVRCFDFLLVDCFDERSSVVSCLKDVGTWRKLLKKVKPGGRIAANVSTRRGRGAKLEDAVACAQSLANASEVNEVNLWRSGACGIWNEVILSGSAVDWTEVAARNPSFAALTKDWVHVARPANAGRDRWLFDMLRV